MACFSKVFQSQQPICYCTLCVVCTAEYSQKQSLVIFRRFTRETRGEWCRGSLLSRHSFQNDYTAQNEDEIFRKSSKTKTLEKSFSPFPKQRVYNLPFSKLSQMILIRRVVPPIYLCSVLERQLLISVTVTPVFRRFHVVVCSVAAVSSAEVVGIKPVMTNQFGI